MKVIYSQDHQLHFPRAELYGGEFVTPFERPARVEIILARLRERGLTDIAPPAELDPAPLRKIHDAGFLSFLETCWEEWVAAGYRGEALPLIFPARRMQQRCPRHIDGKLSYYALANETAITAGSWRAAQASCAVVQTAQRLIADGERAAFALCRPPGHHAASDLYGGYCFLNNAAVAAQMFLDQGASRIAILDIDFHHGNGTQDIFYQRSDVLFCSLHGQPEDAFPHFLGYADETGSAAGAGYTHNFPLPPGTAFDRWGDALDVALTRVRAYAPDALVVSLGVDTFKDDPISFFKLDSPDYLTIGGRIGALRCPALFVMEGGYAIDAIGLNTVNVLEGFLDCS